jgi:four helix bundle protein
VDRTAEALKDRTKRFAVSVLEFVEAFAQTAAAQSVARQLARAGTGVAGTYRSACRSRSHKEFTARLGVVLEEIDEAELWLDVATERGMGGAALRRGLLDESRQLRAIFAKAFLTARRRDAPS